MQTELQTALILIRFIFRAELFAQKNCKVAAGCGSYEINFQIYKTHKKPIKPQKPALIKPVKPTGLSFMIKPGFYANPAFALLMGSVDLGWAAPVEAV